MRLSWNKDVIACYFHFYSKPSKRVGYVSYLWNTSSFYANAVAHHCGKTYERAHFYHVGQHSVACSMQMPYSFYGEKVGTYSRNLCPHIVEHSAKLLYIWFASSIINGCCSLRKHRCHDDIGCSCH